MYITLCRMKFYRVVRFTMFLTVDTFCPVYAENEEELFVMYFCQITL